VTRFLIPQERLIDAARRLAEQGDTGPAVIVAEAAVEVEITLVLTRYLTQLGKLSPDTADVLIDALPDAPDHGRVKRAFKSITGARDAGRRS
jgi:hypothetical protein